MSCTHYERLREITGVYKQYISETIYLIDGHENQVAHIVFSVLDDRHEIWISEIKVEREYRGKGYGKQLMNMVKVVAAACKLPIQLAAHPDVVEFYKKCGFRIIQKSDKTSPIDIMSWEP